MQREYTVSLKPDTILSTVELARWVEILVPKQFMAHDKIAIVRSLQDGKNWKPEAWMIKGNFEQPDCPFDVKITHIEDEYEIRQRLRAEEMLKVRQMLEAGAAGDPVAAVAYCLYILENPGHGAPFAGG